MVTMLLVEIFVDWLVVTVNHSYNTHGVSCIMPRLQWDLQVDSKAIALSPHGFLCKAIALYPHGFLCNAIALYPHGFLCKAIALSPHGFLCKAIALYPHGFLCKAIALSPHGFLWFFWS